MLDPREPFTLPLENPRPRLDGGAAGDERGVPRLDGAREYPPLRPDNVGAVRPTLRLGSLVMRREAGPVGAMPLRFAGGIRPRFADGPVPEAPRVPGPGDVPRVPVVAGLVRSAPRARVLVTRVEPGAAPN